MSKQRNSSAAPRRDQKTGTWWFVVDLPPGPDGKRRQAKRRGFSTKKAATEDMDRLRVKARDGNYVAPKRQTVGAFLTDEWLPSLRVKLEASTLESYERMVRCHVVDRIGGVMLQQLSGAHLNHLYADLLANGRRDGKGGLSARSVRYLHTILHAAFDDACRWERVAVNVAERADPPSASAARPPEMVVWTAANLGRFLDATVGDRYQPPFLFLATTGCRRGEALGLRWSDVDLDAARASIRQQVTAVEDRVVFSSRTKTGKPRLIELDAVTVGALRSWRARQAEERLAMGAGWQEHGLVFTHPDGRPYHPKRFSREFDRRIARHGLPRIRLHDLRHTWATLALEAGIDVKVVAERLGHSSVATTWATYQHVTRPMASDAAEKVAGLIFGGQGR